MLVVADAHLLYWFLAANVTTGVFNFATDSLKCQDGWPWSCSSRTFADAFWCRPRRRR